MKLLKKIARAVKGSNDSGPPILNEAVNFDKQCIFIAVPKTGTTTVRVQLRQEGSPLIKNPHLNIMQIRDSLYVHFLKNALGKTKDFPSESVPSDADLRAQAKQMFDTFFKFSAVRNPWARAVSLWSRREGVEMKDQISFDEFCEKHLYASDTCRHPTLHQNQLDWLCDENGLLLMDYTYKLEDFANAAKEIEERTNGRIKLANISKNVNPTSRSEKYRELYTDRTRKLIASRFERDIDHFGYTF